MHKIIIALAIIFAAFAHAATPKAETLVIPSNTTSAVTSVAIGDIYNYERDVDAVKLVVSGKTDTNVVLVATVGQVVAGLTNTMYSVSFTANATSLLFPRNIITTNHLERYSTDTVTLSCAFVTATNTAVSTTLTNASAVSITVKAK